MSISLIFSHILENGVINSLIVSHICYNYYFLTCIFFKPMGIYVIIRCNFEVTLSYLLSTALHKRNYINICQVNTIVIEVADLVGQCPEHQLKL